MELLQCFGLWAGFLITEGKSFNLEYCRLSIPASRFSILSIRWFTSDNIFVFQFHYFELCIHLDLASCLIVRLTLYEDLSLWFERVFRIFVLFWVCARDPITDFTIILMIFAVAFVQNMTIWTIYLSIFSFSASHLMNCICEVHFHFMNHFHYLSLSNKMMYVFCIQLSSGPSRDSVYLFKRFLGLTWPSFASSPYLLHGLILVLGFFVCFLYFYVEWQSLFFPTFCAACLFNTLLVHVWSSFPRRSFSLIWEFAYWRPSLDKSFCECKITTFVQRTFLPVDVLDLLL